MSLFTQKRPDYLIKGERARLIPVISDSKKEEKLTSCTLATLMSVDEFATSMLASIGERYGKRSKIECFTEVGFADKNKDTSKKKHNTPDGLIVVTTGNKKWRALIESKIGNEKLEVDQINDYLDLANKQKIDALITISNQFTPSVEHHPIQVRKTKTKNVKLYHWSWTYLITEALMSIKHHGVADPDQAYILEELVRYMSHDKSGVTPLASMNSSWKNLCASIHNNSALKTNNHEVLESLAHWDQLTRNMALDLSLEIKNNVGLHLTRKHRDKPDIRLNDNARQLISKKILSTEFDIPNAASKVLLNANLDTRSVTVSMRVDAPKDIPTSRGRIGWLMRHLKKTKNSKNILIRVIWPKSAPDTDAFLHEMADDGMDKLLCDNTSLRPVAFEIILTHDLGVDFSRSRIFVQKTKPLLLDFYTEVGQHLKAWVANAPKVKDKEKKDQLDQTNDGSQT